MASSSRIESVLRRPLALLALAAAVAAACSSAGGGDGGGDGVGGGAGDASAGSGGAAASGGSAAMDGGGFDAGSMEDVMLNEDSACAADRVAAEPVPLNLYIMLDRSGSMNGARWTQATNGIRTFVEDPGTDGISVALSYFPAVAGDDCESVSYATPVVPLAPLTADPAPMDAQEAALVQSLTTTQTTGLTPMAPAFAGLMGFSLNTAMNEPNEKVVAILLTDGSPQGCSGGSPTNDISTIASLASQGAQFMPPVTTFAIGLQGSNESDLQVIAQAGGGSAFFLGGSANVQQDLLQKLRDISGGVLACEYQIPEEGDAGVVDPSFVNVRYTPTSGAPSDFVNVPNATSCVPNGWYYDNPASPEKIILCPDACTIVQGDAGNAVEVLLGCATVVPT